MSNKLLLLTKNDFEGMASAIITKYIYGDNVDIKFYNYKAPATQLTNDLKDYHMFFAVGLQNSANISNASAQIQATGFEDFYNKLSEVFPEDFSNNSTLIEFKENASSYIDWSWSQKKLYYGKNIDELAKYIDKLEVIDKVAERISKLEPIVTDIEKEMLIFAKKIMTTNIQNKRYEIKIVNGKKFAVTYGEMYEIELANHILSQEKDIDAVVIFNMTTKIVRIKTAKGVNYSEQISQAGGLTNSNGGTIKFGNMFDNTIFMSILNKL